MLSATPGDTWMDYVPVFIANGFYKNRTQFKLEHVVYTPYARFPKISRYVAEGRLVKLREKILVPMPYPKQTIRHSITKTVGHNEDMIQSIIKNRWHLIHNRPIRDIAELFQLMRRVINSDPSRVRRFVSSWRSTGSSSSSTTSTTNWIFSELLVRRSQLASGMDTNTKRFPTQIDGYIWFSMSLGQKAGTVSRLTLSSSTLLHIPIRTGSKRTDELTV
jgi:hypothetical protein